MTALLVAAGGAYGVHLAYTALALHWTGLGPGPRRTTPPTRRALSTGRLWLVQAGLEGVRPGEFLGVVLLLAAVCGLGAYALFGGLLPAAVVAAFAASFPPASYRTHRRQRRERAHDAWPRVIDEIRVLTSSAGRSIPQALFEAGRRAPAELQPALDAGHREWLLSTDFARTVDVLETLLADPTADATFETLLVAHELGGTDLGRRLTDLASDRLADVHSRKDARARQAGARFARTFVLLVPLGMALAGLSVGTGRAAYTTVLGQAVVVGALGLVIACWIWAGRLMRLPESGRVRAR
jgi:tight adherence protein B